MPNPQLGAASSPIHALCRHGVKFGKADFVEFTGSTVHHWRDEEEKRLNQDCQDERDEDEKKDVDELPFIIPVLPL